MNTSYKRQEKQKIRSKDWLSNAFLDLLKEKCFSQITIKEICEKADLSPRTYYRLFSSKEELITYHLEKLCLEYRDLFEGITDTRLPNVTLIFFDFWKKQKDFLLIIKQNNLAHLIFEVFLKLLPSIYTDSNEKPIVTKDLEARSYMAVFCAGGYATLLLKWLDNDCIDTAEFMQNVIYNLVLMNQDKTN